MFGTVKGCVLRPYPFRYCLANPKSQRCPYRKSHPGWRRSSDGLPSRRDARSLEAARRIPRRIVPIACGPRSRDGIPPPAAACVEAVCASQAPVAYNRWLCQLSSLLGAALSGCGAIRSSSFQNTERDGCPAHVVKAPRSARNVLTHARSRAEEVSEFVRNTRRFQPCLSIRTCYGRLLRR